MPGSRHARSRDLAGGGPARGTVRVGPGGSRIPPGAGDREPRRHDLPDLPRPGDPVTPAPRLTKTYGTRTAVDGISFTVEPGRVTGFLGPNGAGKSTTMRMVLGLDRPTSGSVTVNGRRYAEHPAPLREVGALLEARALHPGRSARDHLRWLAASNGIPRTRVDEVLDLVGLTE